MTSRPTAGPRTQDSGLKRPDLQLFGLDDVQTNQTKGGATQ